MNNNVVEIAQKLLSYDEITIISHIRPDGDTLGSAYALYHALKFHNKKVQVVCETEISPRYRFLSEQKSNIANDCFGKIVCVDIAAVDMAGQKYSKFAENADIVIDHHETNTGFGKLNLINPDAAACGEIMLEVVKQLCPINKCIAECLYTAISTDTGCFVYANTTANTHKVASELLNYGVDIEKLNKWLFRTKSKAAFEIEKHALESLEYFYNDKIVCMLIPLDIIKKLNATEDDLEGIASIPGQISGVIATATFRQTSEDSFKLSVRTNGQVHAGEVCKKFGGGGHKMAAGCNLSGDYKQLATEFAKTLYENLK